MKLNLNTEQINLLNKIGFDFDVEKDLLDEEIILIDEKVSDHFSYHGLGDNDTINKTGKLCESIMNMLGDC